MHKFTLYRLVISPVLVCILNGCFQTEAEEAEKILGLPTLFQPSFLQYSGYLSGSDPSRKYFYWLTESQSPDPALDPLILWIHGGYSCSSLVGLLADIGPFKVDAHTMQLYENIFSWNKVANMLFIEVTVGNGFSYSTIPVNGTNKLVSCLSKLLIAANDIYFSLLEFLKKFSKYRDRRIYIGGQNSASIYVLVVALKLHNDKANFREFRGAILGNAAIKASNVVVNARELFAYYHGFVPQEVWTKVKRCCLPSGLDSCDFAVQCPDLVNHLSAAAAVQPGNDWKNVFKRCYTNDPRKFLALKAVGIDRQPCPNVGNGVSQTSGFDKWIEAFLNTPAVKEAIHVRRSGTRMWKTCTPTPDFDRSYKQHPNAFTDFIKAKIRLLLYYGDADMAAPHFGAARMLHNLKLPLLQRLQPWHLNVAVPSAVGFVTLYENIDFLTVKGGGHFTAQNKPREVLQIIANFIWETGNYSKPHGLDLRPQPLLGEDSRANMEQAQNGSLWWTPQQFTFITAMLSIFTGLLTWLVLTEKQTAVNRPC